MKIFACQVCGQTLYFQNVQCLRCGHKLGFAPDRTTLLALEPVADDLWQPAGEPDGPCYALCGNYAQYAACNWLRPAADGPGLCLACSLNRTIPDLSEARFLDLWRVLQSQKNRLVYTLLRLGLPVVSKQQAAEQGLAFDFLADSEPTFREGGGVTTGHAGGVITLDVAEADHAVRERVRQKMAEPYRTILGHLRHESGHYYWDRLVAGSRWEQEFRERFGDEREDYQQALERHYGNGPPADWQERFVSAYASCHAWEDWAESWAHYLHIVDTLETAQEFGLRPNPRAGDVEPAPARRVDPLQVDSFDPLMDYWLPLTAALNSLNHSMGLQDAYPFVLSADAVAKLVLIHQIVREAGQAA